eukprot:76506-Pelagomonas_calceolata.AAC.1
MATQLLAKQQRLEAAQAAADLAVEQMWWWSRCVAVAVGSTGLRKVCDCQCGWHQAHADLVVEQVCSCVCVCVRLEQACSYWCVDPCVNVEGSSSSSSRLCSRASVGVSEGVEVVLLCERVCLGVCVGMDAAHSVQQI